MTMAEPGRCFCTLKRVKNFLTGTVSQDPLYTLAVLSVEKLTMIDNIINFNDKVIDKFTNHKEMRMEVVYKDHSK